VPYVSVHYEELPNALAEAARATVTLLRDTEKADVIIALSHGGLEKGKDGRFTDGEDVRLARAVPGIDVIGAHSHTELHEPIIANGHTPVVQTGKYGENLGELMITLDGDKLTVESCRLYPIDDTIAGDPAIGEEIAKVKQAVTEIVFAPRGYSIDQPLAVAPRDIPNTFTDIAANTILASLCTDAFRSCPFTLVFPRAESTSRVEEAEKRRVSRPCTTCSPWRRSAPASWTRRRAARCDGLLHRTRAEASAGISAGG
jgi:5'-nucleotidase